MLLLTRKSQTAATTSITAAITSSRTHVTPLPQPLQPPKEPVMSYETSQNTRNSFIQSNSRNNNLILEAMHRKSSPFLSSYPRRFSLGQGSSGALGK
ncbi:hypothetical protein SO802_010583 [Lithocarpus litseifolius]|uniref:Uncharacterized protein n=1 Tax=Lithocarpus litseifolius TaxID=425828 RepID=A0AAW2DK76_9ROSI